MPDYLDGKTGIHGKKVIWDTTNGKEYTSQCYGYIDAFNKTDQLTDQFISSNNSDAPSGIWPYDMFRVLHKAYPHMRNKLIEKAIQMGISSTNPSVTYSSLIANDTTITKSMVRGTGDEIEGVDIYAYAPTIKGPFVGYLQPDSGYKDWLNELGFYYHPNGMSNMALVNPVSYTKVKVMDRGINNRPNSGFNSKLFTINPNSIQRFLDREGKFTFYTYRFTCKRKLLFSSTDKSTDDQDINILAIIFGDQHTIRYESGAYSNDGKMIFIGPDHSVITDGAKRDGLINRMLSCLDYMTKRIIGPVGNEEVVYDPNNSISIMKYQIKQPKSDQIFLGRRGNDSSYLKLNNSAEPVLSSNYITQIGNDVQAFVNRSINDRINYIYNYESFEDYYIPLGTYNLYFKKTQNTLNTSDFDLLEYDVVLTDPWYWDRNSRSDLIEVTDLTSNFEILTSANQLSEGSGDGSVPSTDTRQLANTDLFRIISNLIEKTDQLNRSINQINELVSKLNKSSGINPELDETNGDGENFSLRRRFLKW